MTIVSFINYKGGVGKSTTAYHIGCSLALHHEKRVLLVDVDPQTNLTFLCATPERWQEFKGKNGTLASLYRAYLDDKNFDIKNIIWKEPIEQYGEKAVEGLDIIPSDIELLGIDLDLQIKSTTSNDLRSVANHYIEQRTILYNSLSSIQDDYDYILIDCPPNIYLVTQNALAASDGYVVTALPDHLSTIGLSILQERVEKLNNELSHASAIVNKDINSSCLKGIICIRVRMGGRAITVVHRRKINELSRLYPNEAFENYTTEGIGYAEASERALPVFLINSINTNKVAPQYRDITNEFIKKVT